MKDGLGKFEPGGSAGAVDDNMEREQRLNALPPDQKELAQETARLADLCQYFSATHIDIPAQIVAQIGSLSGLAIPPRIRVLQDINRALMEYLNDVGQDNGFRQ